MFMELMVKLAAFLDSQTTDRNGELDPAKCGSGRLYSSTEQAVRDRVDSFPARGSRAAPRHQDLRT